MIFFVEIAMNLITLILIDLITRKVIIYVLWLNYNNWGFELHTQVYINRCEAILPKCPRMWIYYEKQN